MQQSRAIIVGSAVVGVCILANLGYAVFRDWAMAEATRKELAQQIIDEQSAESNRIRQRIYDLRLGAYERQFGHIERLRLEAFSLYVRAESVAAACEKQSLSAKLCGALEKNRKALFAAGEAKFMRPPE
jgi:signal transduction histidine kinase